jgi:hypothetical protein
MARRRVIRRHGEAGRDHQRRGNTRHDRIRDLLQHAVLRTAGRARNQQAEVIDDVPPQTAWRELFAAWPDVRAKVTADDAGQQIDDARQH